MTPFEQEMISCVENIEMLLEERAEYPLLRGPLRVYGAPKCITAALGLSLRYLSTGITAMGYDWERLPIDFQLRAAEAFDRATARTAHSKTNANRTIRSQSLMHPLTSVSASLGEMSSKAQRREENLELNAKAAKVVAKAGILLLSFLTSGPLLAQVAVATLSGTITDPSAKAVASAKVSVKNVGTGQSVETQTDLAGLYHLPSLAPGDYEISVSAEGFSTSVDKVTITQGSAQTVNMTLGGVLSLGDLGFPPGQTQGSAQDQARLDKRSHMLKIHQRLGLIDTVPLVATVILGTGSGGRSTSSSDRWAHLALGSVTRDLYFMSAYYAIRAPRIPGAGARGPIRLHKVLAWVHGPGMILTPILGAIAFDQKSRGEKVHGIASAHGAVAIVTAAAYGAAILSVSFKF